MPRTTTRIVSLIVTIAFVFTQCGLSFAAPALYRNGMGPARNLRQMELSQRPEEAAAIGAEIAAAPAAGGEAAAEAKGESAQLTLASSCLPKNGYFLMLFRSLPTRSLWGN